jgi:hypothetical protein
VILPLDEMITLNKKKGKYIYRFYLKKRTRRNKDNKIETFIELINMEKNIYEKTT